MSDLEKKTLRHFYCRDSLWRQFEAISEAEDRGIDDLVNEAMAAFADGRGHATGVAPRATTTTPPAPPRAPMRTPMPPPPPASRAVPPPLPSPRNTAPRAAVGAQPPLPADFGRSEAPTPPLYLIFDNRKYRIDKDQFIIGRGVKSSDLPIRDGNISRKHCAVIRKNGAFYIKDLGSTNGIDFNGMRIDNKRIEEGDVYYLCDYQLRFTFQ